MILKNKEGVEFKLTHHKERGIYKTQFKYYVDSYHFVWGFDREFKTKKEALLDANRIVE